MTRHLEYILTLILMAPLMAMAGPVMYVPTGDANEVLIIDLKTDTIIGHINELENAHGLAASPNSEFLVAGSMQTVKADEIKNSGAAKPGDMSEEEHKAHHEQDPKNATTQSYISIIHPKHGHVMRRIAVRGLTHHTAVSPDGNVAIAVHSQNGGISVIDLNANKVIHFLKTGEVPNYALFSPDGSRLYVSNAGSGNVSEIETNKWSVTRTIPVGKEPEHMALSPSGRTLYVVNVMDGTASEIALATGEVVREFMVGNSPHGIALSDDGKHLFISSKGDNLLKRFNIESGKSMQLDLASAPYHVEFIGGLNKLYVSSRNAPKIWVVDPKRLDVLSEIEFDKGVAHQMVIVEQK